MFLRLFGGAGAVSFSIGGCFTSAERLALHAVEQLLYGGWVRGFVPLREYHRTGRRNTAEQGRINKVIEDEVPRYDLATGQKVHRLGEAGHERAGHDCSAYAEAEPADFRKTFAA